MLLIGCGTAALFLATIGIFVPILPTTPFLLLAAFGYARSSQRFYRWLVYNRWFGAYLRHYREGRGIPLHMKAVTLTGLWVTIGLTAVRVVSSPWARLALVAIAVAVTIHLLKIKTLRADEGTASSEAAPVAEAVQPEE